MGLALSHETAQRALNDTYSEIDRLISLLDASDFFRPSACGGWFVGDVLFHLLTDAQSLLVSLSGSLREPATVDSVTYWRNYATWRNVETDMAQARFVRIGASAYVVPDDLARHWKETSEAVVKVTDYAPGERNVRFLGHVMSITDLFAIVSVEATIHHLDMIAHLGGRPGPRPGPLSLAVDTLDALMGGIDRPEWDDLTFVAKATGRAPVSVPEQRYLDERGIRFPLIG